MNWPVRLGGASMNWIQKVFLNGLLCAVLALSFPVVSRAATLEELESRILKLEQTLEEAKQERQKLEKVVKAAPTRKKDDAANVYLDGKFWPTLVYRDADSHRWVGMEGPSTDIYDVGSKIRYCRGCQSDRYPHRGAPGCMVCQHQ